MGAWRVTAHSNAGALLRAFIQLQVDNGIRSLHNGHIKHQTKLEIDRLQEPAMKSRWVEFSGKRLLYIDAANFRADIKSFDTELTATITTLGSEMYQQPLHSVLVLVDLRNTEMSQHALQILTTRIKDTRAYVKRTAVVGLTGLRRMFLDFFERLAGSDTGSFDEPEAAKQWLITER
jgi:hypothetical protein